LKTSVQKQIGLNFKKEQRLVAFAVAASIIAANSIITPSSTTEGKNLVGNILRPLTAAIAAVFSLKVGYRQKLDGLFGRAYSSQRLWHDGNR
jgi:hypothetical protein